MRRPFDESRIQELIHDYHAQVKVAIPNVKINGWEADYLTVSQANYLTEYEIKLTKADFKADFKDKVEKHIFLENRITRYCSGNMHGWFNQVDVKLPCYFYYVIPEGVIELSEIPEYAGYIEIKYREVLTYMRMIEIKPAPRLHSQPLSPSQLEYIMAKFQSKYWTLVREHNRLRANV